MTVEGIVAIVMATGTALGVAGGFAYQAGAISYRFNESGQRAVEEHKRIREEHAIDVAALRKDLNAMGAKINGVSDQSETGYVQLSQAAQRHHHQISLAVMLIAPPAKESEVVQLLKES